MDSGSVVDTRMSWKDSTVDISDSRADERKRKAFMSSEVDLSKICASTGVSFTGQIAAFTVAERMQHFELAVRTALEAVQFLSVPSDALARGQLACSPPCNDRSELVERLGTAHRILAQRLRNLGARPLPSVRLNRNEQAQHVCQWIAGRLEKDRILAVPDLFAEYFEQHENVIHQCYASSRHAFWKYFQDVVQAYWHTSFDFKGRLVVYFNDPSQPKVSVKRRGADGWEARSVGILKPCQSKDFLLQHSKGYERSTPAAAAAHALVQNPGSLLQSSLHGGEMSPKRFFVPLQSKDALPTRGPDLDFAQTSPPSARRRMHSGIPLSYRSPRAVELVKTAWSRALEANTVKEPASKVVALPEKDILGELSEVGLPELEGEPGMSKLEDGTPTGTGGTQPRLTPATLR